MRQCVGLSLAFVTMAVGVMGLSGPARAQSRRHPSSGAGTSSGAGAGYKGGPLNLQKAQLGEAELPAIGRSRMRNGDCDGAIEAFDAALRTMTDPTIYRDRGICREKLGFPYPAIDDYRVYLTAEPDAPDADGITRRLEALEAQVSGHPQAASTHDDDTPPDLHATGSIDGSVNGKSRAAGAAEGQGSAASDALDYEEPDVDLLQSPLRRGKGFSLAPFFSEHKWISGSTFSAATDSQTWSEAFGAQLRWSLSASGALVAEVGYEYFNATSIDNFTMSGLTSLVGYEVRVPLDPSFDNQFLIVPELGYESLTVSAIAAGSSSTNFGAFVPRLRLGWRHMLERATALDVSIDGGVGSFFAYANFPFDSSQTASGLLTINLSVAWGL
jgi:hypothetical protein